jgi:hypothetical protein
MYTPHAKKSSEKWNLHPKKTGIAVRENRIPAQAMAFPGKK